MIPSAIPRQAATHIEMAAPSAASVRVYIALAGCCGLLLAFDILAAPPGAFSPGIHLVEATVLLLPALLIAPASFHQRGAWDRRDAILMLPWTLVLAALIAQAAPSAVAFGAPLRDDVLRSIDLHLGSDVPAIMAFTHHHPHLDAILTFNYYWMLHPILLSAIFLPACMGKRVAAQRFVLVNAIGFVLALPCMILLPAIGPWVAWHFPPNIAQVAVEKSIRSLHRGAMTGADSFGGIICFPSFHVFWAVVSAHALQAFRVLRYPSIIVAALITASTVTTGWHYAVDVLGGLILAVVCTWVVNAFMSLNRRSNKGSEQ